MRTVYDSNAERYTTGWKMPRLHRGTKVRITMQDGTVHEGFWGGMRNRWIDKSYGERVNVGGVAVYSECEVLESINFKMVKGDRVWLDITSIGKVER